MFHLAMPNAAKVELHLEGVKDPFPMTKGPDGAWSIAVPKLAPQYYSYASTWMAPMCSTRTT